jgi:hypothetical protein
MPDRRIPSAPGLLAREGWLRSIFDVPPLLRRTAVRVRATVADHGDALDFQHHPRRREVRYGNQRAGGKIAVGKHLSPDGDETVAVARIVDEHGHGHHVGETAAGLLENRIDPAKGLPRLRVEVKKSASDLSAVW